MSRNLEFSQGEYYHIYNRGTEKRAIFTKKSDYERFIALLYLANGTSAVHISNHQGSTLMTLLDLNRGDPLIEIGAYCLMPNHFHLIVRESEKGGVSRFLQKLATGYTMYFNKRYERTGSLFQGRFKAKHIDNDEYLKYLIAYVHLNPIKLIDSKWEDSGIKNKKLAKKYLDEYHYSSYRDYVGFSRIENKIINKHSLPEYFKTVKDFQTNVTDWLRYKSLDN